MRKQTDAVLRSFREDGILITLHRIIIRLVPFPAGIAFALYDRLVVHEAQDTAIIIRGSKPESDTYALLDEIVDQNVDCTLHIISNKRIRRSQLALWENKDGLFTTSILHTLSCFRALSQSNVVLCKGDPTLRWYRWFDKSDRRYIRLYHGPITKAYEKTQTNPPPIRITKDILSFDLAPRYRSVGSDVELHFRTASEGRHPKKFYNWGYPRFDRIHHLVHTDATPIIPEKTVEVLDNKETTNILYAPTRKEDTFENTFFSYSDFDADRLHSWCRENNTRLFLRPHPSNEIKRGNLINEELVYFAGQTFSNSSIELMPFIDVLITDYSSIYIEFLPFGGPIVFDSGRHNEFSEARGVAFNYDKYFPGPKADTFDELLECLEEVIDDQNRYANDREFVKKTFVPERERTFLNKVLKINGNA